MPGDRTERYNTSCSTRFANVAELADALDLGSSARKGVRVQVSPFAPMAFSGVWVENCQDFTWDGE